MREPDLKEEVRRSPSVLLVTKDQSVCDSVGIMETIRVPLRR